MLFARRRYEFYKGLHFALDQGELPQAVAAAAADCGGILFRRVLADVVGQVHGSSPLHEALAGHTLAFPAAVDAPASERFSAAVEFLHAVVAVLADVYGIIVAEDQIVRII